MIEFEVDLKHLAETNQLDEVRLRDENGLFEPVEYILYEKCYMETDDECGEVVEGRWWHCDGCDESFVYERGWKPRFCPECGRARLC